METGRRGTAGTQAGPRRAPRPRGGSASEPCLSSGCRPEERGAQSHTGLASPGFQCREEASPQLPAVKTSGAPNGPGRRDRGPPEPQTPRKGPARELAGSRALTPGSGAGAATPDEPGADGERLGCVAPGRGLRDSRLGPCVELASRASDGQAPSFP